jgi:hypothetical protein
MEIVPAKPVNWSSGYQFYKFDFANQQDCQIQVNGGSPIFLRAGQGFSSNINDAAISSFIVVTANVQFNWIGHY